MSRQLGLFVPNTPQYTLLRTCETIVGGTINLVVSLASVRKEPTNHGGALPQYQQLQLAPTLAQRFQEIVAAALDKVMAGVEDGGNIGDYNTGAELHEDVLWHLHVVEGQNVARQRDPLSSCKDFEIFEEHKDFIKGLRYYVVSLQARDNPEAPFIHAFRFFGEGFELNRKRWAAIRTGRGRGYYEALQAHGFLFDNEIDCFCYENDMFVLNKDTFQKIFRFYEQAQEDARRSLYSLQQRIPISNVDEFVAACDRDARLAVKLADLEKQPYTHALTMAHVKRIINRNGLPIEIIEKDGREMLVFTTANKWIMLHLLSDDFLDSPMTGLGYKTSNKVVMKNTARDTPSAVTAASPERSTPARPTRKRARVAPADVRDEADWAGKSDVRVL